MVIEPTAGSTNVPVPWVRVGAYPVMDMLPTPGLRDDVIVGA